MSTHEALVVKVGPILPHPDPETIRLGLTKVWDYTVVVAKDQWQEGQLAVYIEPDTLVPLDRPEFSFLSKGDGRTQERIKARRLRGTWSEGLLIPAPEGMVEGQDVWSELGLERYVPTLPKQKNPYSSSAFISGPEHIPTLSKYDLENFKKNSNVLTEDEIVVVTEKIHGTNWRCVYDPKTDQFFVGSRSGWKALSEKDTHWQAFSQNEWVKDACRSNPGFVIYGEAFGQVQDLRYGAGPMQIFVRLFDAYNYAERKFVDAKDFLVMFPDEQRCPTIYVGPYSKEKILELTDGQSVIDGANCIREGCVIKPEAERIHPRIGRVALKSVSNNYLERSK
jgi:RNA ligase (TIGR02306 family)